VIKPAIRPGITASQSILREVYSIVIDYMKMEEM
jgi:hypothetical protein